ncbi:MAG: helix-turn-helix domain-containing protein [Lachnospiraceae bacterium]|nr:helix-turn-helix domain-containing protein [Lachnospiraceae bacterium]
MIEQEKEKHKLMQEDKGALHGASEADQDFSRFLKQMREEAHVSLKQLSEGLMSASQLGRIERGERSVCKNMRDCLLGRMGISSDLYENLLNIEDYAAWESQRNILGAVEQKDFLGARELIAAYEKLSFKGIKDKIKQQFCLVMRAEILKQQGADRRGIGDCYEEAIRVTVPKVESVWGTKKLLSIQEVNILLEYAYHRRGTDFGKQCKELISFVENSLYDDLSKAKIYPKIVYYYLREMFHGQGEQDAELLRECLEICSRAVEMLRDTGRAYYLLELLEMRIRIAGCIERDRKECVNIQDWDKFREDYQESVEMLDLLKTLYVEYEVPPYMQDCTYLYQQRWVFYVGDVLRIRRKMFGMTQEELCGIDCSVKSLRRTEKKEKNMQHEALGILLRRLGLSKEFQRARLAASDRAGLKLMETISDCRNNRELQQAREILKRMKERISDKIPENRQYFMEVEASLDWMTGEITKEEFVMREEEALRCTLQVKDLYDMDEVYLTEMEILCICKRIQVLPDTEKRKCIDFLFHIFEGDKIKNTLSDCISIYDFLIIHLSCGLGNLKEHQRSVDLAEKVLREDLKCKRILGIERYLYEKSWNDNTKMTECLISCITISHFCKQTFYEDFYYRKLHQS